MLEGTSSFKEESIALVNKIIQRIYNWKFLTILSMEINTFVKSKKFIAFFVIFLFPVLVMSFPPLENASKISLSSFLRFFEENTSDEILSYWAGIPAQVIAAMVASEMIARELDKETIKLLFTKPLRKAEIVIGKFLAFVMILLLVLIPVLITYSTVFVLTYEKGYEELLAILSSSFWWGLGVILLSLCFVGSLAIAMSTILKRSLYAALATILLIIAVQLLIVTLPFLKNADTYTFAYQLGVILEEVYYLGGSNIYKGDPYLSFTFFMVSIIASLIVAEVTLVRKEVP